MKKIIFMFLTTLLILAGCNQDGDSLSELHESFNRNHEDLSEDINEALEDISEENNRKEQLATFYDELTPKFDDFKQTVSNYTFSSEAPQQLQEDIIQYLEELEALIRMYGDFNLNFHAANPLTDEHLSDTFDEELKNITEKEDAVRQTYEDITRTFDELLKE